MTPFLSAPFSSPKLTRVKSRFRCLCRLWLALLLSGAGLLHGQQSDGRLEGLVTDQSGLPVEGADILLKDLDSFERRAARTGPSGRFELPGLSRGTYELEISAAGFAEHLETLSLRPGETRTLEIRLALLTLTETITVTPTRNEQKMRDISASVSVIDQAEVAASPALVMDDVLRQVPAFSLFRRSSSLTTHPTAQGVSLRGLGPSGVSRTLVLLDGFPFNDPFGGWVYWDRVPLTALDRIEVVEGPSSNVYGNFAMGGVVHILTRQPRKNTLVAEGRFGNHQTAKADFFASRVWGPWGVSVDGSLIHTDGFHVVAGGERGAVDTRANLSSEAFNVKVDYSPSERFRFFLKGSYADEDRNNGTILQVNDTQWRFFGGGLHFLTPDDSEWQISIFSRFQTFGSQFSAVGEDRNSERLALDQEVPVEGWGGLIQWSKSPSAEHLLTAGVDWNWADGDSRETVFIRTPAVPVRGRMVGGRQRTIGVFLQDAYSPLPSLQVLLSARVDHWRNYQGNSHEMGLLFNNQVTDIDLPDKDNSVVSGRVGLLYHWNRQVSTWAAVSTGFRAPTLNELYRQFRVGSVTTLANSDLGPERLLGGEGGLNFSAGETLLWRVTGFWNRVRDPVANVTLEVTPNLITRQRQNLGRTRIWGVQTDVEFRPAPRWQLKASYLFNESTVREFPANPVLEGLRLPQVARHRLTLGASYTAPQNLTLSLQGRLVGPQFDDDLNLLPLGGYFVLDLTASKSLSEYADLFVAVENLFDREYPVRNNPRTVGSPALFQGGLRFRLN